MTENDRTDKNGSTPAYERLRMLADRIARGDTGDMPEEEQLDLLRLTHELELARVELEAQNEQLRQISRDLEASRGEFHDLYEMAPVAFVSLDKKGIVKRANAAARQMLTGPDGQLVENAFSSFVAPEDMRLYFQQMKKVTDAEMPALFELRFRGKTGSPLHVHCQVSAKLDPEGRFSRWDLAFFDISEQKYLEEELWASREQIALATEAGKIGIWVYELKTGKSHWNDQLYHMLGLEPREGPEEQDTFFNYIHPEDRRGALKDIQSILKLGDSVDLKLRVIRADDGRVRWLAARGVIDRDEAGRAVRIRGVNFDITDSKKSEESLRLAQLQLAEQLEKTERINEELSQFAYAASHDLKAPLRAIRNYSDFLYEDLAEGLSGEQKAYLEGLRIAADQGQNLIDDLLEYSRIGRIASEAESVDMPAIIDEVKSFLNLPSDINLTVQKDWPVFEADPILLSQIMKNLIGNAVKFNHSASKQVDIGWHQTDQNGAIEIFVRDNGVGIDTEYQEQIFGIFQRLHTSKKYEGTGIGLAVVQKAAQEMGGAVRVESTQGEGSTFFVEIPVRLES
jgi:hypothetical protein